jgi:hypothetical protein
LRTQEVPTIVREYVETPVTGVDLGRVNGGSRPGLALERSAPPRSATRAKNL